MLRGGRQVRRRADNSAPDLTPSSKDTPGFENLRSGVPGPMACQAQSVLAPHSFEMINNPTQAPRGPRPQTQSGISRGPSSPSWKAIEFLRVRHGECFTPRCPVLQNGGVALVLSSKEVLQCGAVAVGDEDDDEGGDEDDDGETCCTYVIGVSCWNSNSN